MSDASQLATGSDALINRQALFEPFDKTQGRLRELVFHDEQEFIVLVVFPGLVVWPSRAADAGEEARIV